MGLQISMESAFYGYYYVSKDCISNTWDTKAIELYLLNTGYFSDNGNGSFGHNSTLLSLQLMLVSDYSSWSSNDYNSIDTNYVSIVSTKKNESVIEQFFQDFEIFLGRQIIEEANDD